ELIVCDGTESDIAATAEDLAIPLTPLAPASFDSSSARHRLCTLFAVETLEGFGHFGRTELSAMGALVDYLDITQRGKLPLLRPPRRESTERVMQIDAATRRNLELTHALDG